MSLPRTGADCGQNRFYPRWTATAPRHTDRPGLRHAGRYPGRPGDARRVDGNWHPRVGRGDRPPDPGFTLDDRLQRFMETAARLGAGQVLVAGNDDNLQRSADNLAILAAAGRPFGLTMNLEPMPWTQLRNIAAAQALIAASGRKTSAFWWTLSISGARENRSPPSPACPRIISTICNSAMARRRGRRASRNLSARPARRATCRGRRSGSAWSDVGPAGDAAGLSRSAA